MLPTGTVSTNTVEDDQLSDQLIQLWKKEWISQFGGLPTQVGQNNSTDFI